MATATQVRQGVIDLATLASREIATLPLRQNNLSVTKEILIRALPMIGDKYGLAAGALTADWYDDLRSNQRKVKTRFRATPHPMPDEQRFISLAQWGMSPLFQEEPDYFTAISKIAGGMQRIVMDQQRLTIVDATQVDPESSGWKRTGTGHSCTFCQMLISRGAVYKGKTVTFRAHDSCQCSASPSWDPNVRLVTGEPYKQSARRRSDSTRKADNQRAYEFMADL